MEHYFDEQLQFFKQFDVKAKGKPLKVKKWLLSREYLQPLTEPEEEESSPDDEDTSGYKKKLKCAYDAARYGMKEGVLTGMFFGGCWGIFKNLGDNFPFGFFGFDSVSGKQGKSNVRSRNPAGNSTPNSTETQNTPKNDTANDENTFINAKNMSVVQDKYTERKNQLVYTSVNSKLSARNDNTYLRGIGADLFDVNNFSLQKNPEKVEIVGYAFIHTTGSVSDSTSSDDNSHKNVEVVNKREEKVEPEKVEPEKANDNAMSKPLKRNESNRYSLGSVAGVSSTTKSHGKNKAETNFGGRRSKGSVHAQPSIGKFEHKSRLSKLAEENKSDAPRQKRGNFKPSINQKLKKEPTSKIDFLMPEDRYESEMLLPNAPNNWENADVDSLSHRVSRTHYPSTVTSAKRTSFKKDLNKLKQTRKNLKKGSMEFVSMSRKKADAENIYPDSKKIGSILVDIDAISNGFTSPPDVIATANSSFIQYTEGQLVPWTLVKRSNEKIKREMKTLKFTGSDASQSVDLAETDDRSRYTVESSPMFNRSLVSANLEEGGEKDDDSSHKDLSYGGRMQSRGYLLEEGGSSLPRAIGSITHNLTPQRDSIRSYIVGLETPDTDSNTSPYYTYHDNERLSHDRLPQHLFNLDDTSIQEKTSLSQHENEEKTEKAADENLLKGKSKSIIFNKIADRDYSQQKKQIAETLANYSRESDKTPSIESNSSHYKSKTAVLEGKKRCSVENTLGNKFYTEDRYTKDVEKPSVECKPVPNQQVTKYYTEESQEKPLSVPHERPQNQEKAYVSIGSQTQTRDRSQVQEDKSHSPRQINYDKIHTLEERHPTRGYSIHDKSHGNTVTIGENTVGSPRYTKPFDSHLQSTVKSRKQSTIEGNDGQSVRLQSKGLHSSVYEHESASDQSTAAKSDYSAPAFEKSSHNYLKTKEAHADGISDNVVGGVGSVGETSQQKIQPKKVSAVQKKSEPAEKRKSSRSLNFFSVVNENQIIVSACNCAIVLGIVCSVISTTRASLAV